MGCIWLMNLGLLCILNIGGNAYLMCKRGNGCSMIAKGELSSFRHLWCDKTV